MRGRLLVVTHYWEPHLGGVERVAAEQVRRLGERGWSVEVHTSRLGDDRRRERRDGAVVHRHRVVNVLESRVGVPVPVPGPGGARAVAAAVGRADVVVVHGHVYPLGALAARAARRARVPLVVVQHNPFVDYGPVLDTLERTVDRVLGRAVLHAADEVVAVSRHTEAYVRRIAPRATTSVVGNGVDRSRFSPGPPRDRTGPCRVFTVRRLVARNGVDVLIDAWAAAGLGDRAVLEVAGEGPERAALARRAAEVPGVRLLGRLDDDELVARYRAADVVAVPSRSGEGFGLVIAEAMACGAPVVVTDAGAPPELVTDGVDGLIVPAGDPLALGRALRRVVDDAPLRAMLTLGARRRGEGFCWESVTDSLDAVLVRVRGRQRRAAAAGAARSEDRVTTVDGDHVPGVPPARVAGQVDGDAARVVGAPPAA